MGIYSKKISRDLDKMLFTNVPIAVLFTIAGQLDSALLSNGRMAACICDKMLHRYDRMLQTIEVPCFQ